MTRAARWTTSGALHRATRSGRHREAGGRGHDPSRCADRRRQGSLRHPGLAHRGIVSRREVRGGHGPAREVAHRTGQPCVPRHERRERRRDGRRRGHRTTDLPRQHGRVARGAADRNRVRQGRGALHVAHGPLHHGHGAVGVLHQRSDQGQLARCLLLRLAVAVGLTPEMLPMIVTVCLSKGAMAMARKKVIVKRIDAIQNLGAMDVLCTDKTGTLTMDHVILSSHCDVVLKPDNGVLALAYLNSHFQTGLKNVMDRAVLAHSEATHHHAHIPDYAKIDEIPFDFERRIMSVVVRAPEGKDRIISKGAPEAIFPRCKNFELDGELSPMEHVRIHELRHEYEQLGRNGFRVLAIASKDVEPKDAGYGRDDEKDLILNGYLAFLDPPKDTAAAAIRALQQHGVSVKVVTGDNDLVARKVCSEVGLPTEHTLLGAQIEEMTNEELADAAERTTLFARVSPAHKQRIIHALQLRRHTVGFMGDGINDAPALRAADVGVSVDTAVDIAKESADLILLEKSLLVLEESVMEGRKVFANILKYIGMGASSSFGNMFSVLGASIFVPYLPMIPIQILTNNLLYDVSQTAIPTDEVDSEEIAKPRPWDMGSLAKFILFIGPCSSIFDYTTFLIMLYVFKAWPIEKAALFQTGWFVESLLTQTLIIHVIRTRKLPFLQSRASGPLIAMTAVIMSVGVLIPFTPIGPYLGFTTLPPLYWLLLALTLLAYMLLTQGVKTWLIRRAWV